MALQRRPLGSSVGLRTSRQGSWEESLKALHRSLHQMGLQCHFEVGRWGHRLTSGLAGDGPCKRLRRGRRRVGLRAMCHAMCGYRPLMVDGWLVAGPGQGLQRCMDVPSLQTTKKYDRLNTACFRRNEP